MTCKPLKSLVVSVLELCHAHTHTPPLYLTRAKGLGGYPLLQLTQLTQLILYIYISKLVSKGFDILGGFVTASNFEVVA